MKQVVWGLDVGTTAIKVTAFGVGWDFRETVEREHPVSRPAPDRSEQDPARIRHEVLGAVVELAAASRGADVIGIGLSTAMHGLLGIDEHDQPTTPVITWADSRAAEIAAALRADDEGHALYRRSGMPVHPMSSVPRLRWLAEHEPGVFARTRRWVSLKDWVIHILTGVWVTELSSASATGLLDLATCEWSEESLALAGIARDVLPPIQPTTHALPILPEVAARAGLADDLPVVLGAGDGPLGNVGTRAVTPGVVGLSIGTSGAIRLVVPEPEVDPASGLFCYALTEDLWVVGGAISNGGSAMRWFATQFGSLNPGDRPGDDDLDDNAIELAGSMPIGAEGLAMLPYLLPERAPLWDASLTGAYVGVQAHHTPAHFARATIEGIARQLWLVLEHLRAHHDVTEVRATGGVFRAPLWQQVVAGTLALPVVVGSSQEGSALGAAALAMFALGQADTLLDAVDILDPASAATTAVVASDADIAAYADATTGLRQRLGELDVVRRSLG